VEGQPLPHTNEVRALEWRVEDNSGHRLADPRNLHGKGVPATTQGVDYRGAVLTEVQRPAWQDTTTTQTTGFGLDPRRPTPGETLPRGWFRNPNGLLIRDQVSVPALKLNVEHVTHEIAFLKEHVVILHFLEELGLRRLQNQDGWIKELARAAYPGTIQHHRAAGYGFTYIKFDKPDSSRRAMALSPFRCSAGTATLHRWVPAFDPVKSALFVPVWITLNYLPLEFIDEVDKIVACIGKVLEIDYSTREQSILCYCVEVFSGDPWVSKLCLQSTRPETSEVLINYEGEEVRCYECLQFSHKTRNCPMVTSPQGRQPTQ
jgi:hypothetical protein